MAANAVVLALWHSWRSIEATHVDPGVVLVEGPASGSNNRSLSVAGAELKSQDLLRRPPFLQRTTNVRELALLLVLELSLDQQKESDRDCYGCPHAAV